MRLFIEMIWAFISLVGFCVAAGVLFAIAAIYATIVFKIWGFIAQKDEYWYRAALEKCLGIYEKGANALMGYEFIKYDFDHDSKIIHMNCDM